MKALVLPVTRATWSNTKGYELRDVPSPILDEKSDSADADRVLIEPIFGGVCGTDKASGFARPFVKPFLATWKKTNANIL